MSIIFNNTDKDGNEWSGLMKKAIWQKGVEVPNYDPDFFRQDKFGSWIRYVDFDNQNSESGWEINHIIPLSKGGGDEIDNLQPLHWKENFRIGDD